MSEVRAPGGIDLDNVSAQQELYTLLRGGGALIEASHREGRETAVNAPFFYIAGLLPDFEMIRLDQHIVAIILACLGVDGPSPNPRRCIGRHGEVGAAVPSHHANDRNRRQRADLPRQ